MSTHSGRSPWRTTTTRLVYSNPWIELREDSVIRPDGEPGIYGVVSMQHPSVFVVALTDADEVLMVTLYRYATRTSSLEVPAGGTDGEDPLVAAQRELLEETGYEATSWAQIGRMNALNGVCNAPEFVFLARGLRPASATAGDATDTASEQATEGITTVQAMPWAQLMQAISNGQVSDGETVAALMYAALTLGKLAPLSSN